MLCPVAPFQAALPASAVDQLLDISRHNTASSSNSTTQAWLDQVSQAHPTLLYVILYVAVLTWLCTVIVCLDP